MKLWRNIYKNHILMSTLAPYYWPLDLAAGSERQIFSLPSMRGGVFMILWIKGSNAYLILNKNGLGGGGFLQIGQTQWEHSISLCLVFFRCGSNMWCWSVSFVLDRRSHLCLLLLNVPKLRALTYFWDRLHDLGERYIMRRYNSC